MLLVWMGGVLIRLRLRPMSRVDRNSSMRVCVTWMAHPSLAVPVRKRKRP